MARIIRISNWELTLAVNEPTKNPSPNKYAEESGDASDWIGHTLRRPTGREHHAPGQLLEWNPEGGTMSWASQVRVTWRRSCEEETKACGQSWSQVEKTAENRVQWRCATESLCSTRNPRDK
ncbi:unnamed protein product [Heterobilharzia americana]|nr:unnamed protein product [Heterobilharzia americana]